MEEITYKSGTNNDLTVQNAKITCVLYKLGTNQLLVLTKTYLPLLDGSYWSNISAALDLVVAPVAQGFTGSSPSHKSYSHCRAPDPSNLSPNRLANLQVYYNSFLPMAGLGCNFGPAKPGPDPASITSRRYHVSFSFRSSSQEKQVLPKPLSSSCLYASKESKGVLNSTSFASCIYEGRGTKV